MVGGNDKMFMTRSLNVTPKTTEQHLHAIVHSDISVAYVTNNNKKLSCRTEAARCFVFVCSQLQHTYSAVFYY